eukprot:38876-Eustigmatos_ZCMA.PRE.1
MTCAHLALTMCVKPYSVLVPVQGLPVPQRLICRHRSRASVWRPPVGATLVTHHNGRRCSRNGPVDSVQKQWTSTHRHEEDDAAQRVHTHMAPRSNEAVNIAQPAPASCESHHRSPQLEAVISGNQWEEHLVEGVKTIDAVRRRIEVSQRR